jgi:integrase
MATIRKHREKYQVQVRRKGFPPISKTFLLLSDAKEWARHIERQADRAELGPDRKALELITLGELVARYRDTVLPGKKGGPFERILLSAFLRHPICKKRLSDLTVFDFATWRDEKIAKGKGKRPITPKSAKRILSPVQRLLQLAMDEWGIPLRENPVAKLRMDVIDNRRERRLRPGEFERLTEAAAKSRNPHALPIIRFALQTAMRRGEILALQWRDIDLARRTATIREAKNGHSRTIVLTADAISIIEAAVTGLDDIAPGRTLFPVEDNAYKLVWKRLVRRAGIDDLHFHDLRHEAISRLFEIGLTVPEVASISGHRDMRMLFRYAHATHASIRAKFSPEKLDKPNLTNFRPSHTLISANDNSP